MKDLFQAVKQFLTDRRLYTQDHTFLLACSGGIDSMVLTHIFQKLQLRVAVTHCNFNLRGKDSKKDEAFVETYAQTHNIPFFAKSFDTQTYAQDLGISIQMAARELRYSFFNELMNQNGFDFLVTAHHLDDSLETLLINLGRGTGIFGLGGIPLDDNKVLRPLSSIEKYELQRYAQDYDLKWREDSSNAKDDYQRNYIRHHVSPSLKEANPHFSSGFRKSLNLVNLDLQLYEYFLKETFQKISQNKEGKTYVNVLDLKDLPSPSSLLHFWLSPLDSFDISAIERSLNSESGKVFETEKYRLLKDRSHLILQPQSDLNPDDEYLIQIESTGIQHPISLEIEIQENAPIEIPKEKAIVALDFDKLKFPLKLRKWKAGDRFTPLGMQQSKKLSDFFIDQKLSRFDKSAIWLLCSGDDIVWIIGHRINDLYKITNHTKSTYFVRLLK
jgi:tRNA(Ile)-lysidine synthase